MKLGVGRQAWSPTAPRIGHGFTGQQWGLQPTHALSTVSAAWAFPAKWNGNACATQSAFRVGLQSYLPISDDN